MHQKLDYENFLVSRPLFAKFKRGKYGIPQLWETKLSIERASYAKVLNYRNLSTKNEINDRIIECFAYDSQLETIWRNPFSNIKRLRKALVVLTPDFSITPSMSEAQVIASTFKNRWLGCFYQQYSIEVIPTVSWAESWTYSICLEGIPEGNPIAISTLGIDDKNMFLEGYNYVCKIKKPRYVICFGNIIKGMKGNIISFDYEESFMPKKENEQLYFIDVTRLQKIDE